METCSFYIKLLKEGETLCVPTSRVQTGVKVQKAHSSTPVQNKAVIKYCSPPPKLSDP